MNDLATLLAPQPDQMLSNDISAATLNSQRLRKPRAKDTWIQKLRKGGNYQADPEKIKEYKNRSPGLQAIGGTEASSALTKETSVLTLQNNMSQATIR